MVVVTGNYYLNCATHDVSILTLVNEVITHAITQLILLVLLAIVICKRWENSNLNLVII